MKERLEASALRYSDQAVTLLERMKDDFPLEAFEAWVEARFCVGGGDVIAFLKEYSIAIKEEEAKQAEIIAEEEKQEEPVAPEPTPEELEAKHEAEKYFSSGTVPLPPVVDEPIKEEPVQEDPTLES